MRHDEPDDPLRRILIQALSAGFFGSGLTSAGAFADSLFGSRPAKLPPNQSIYRLNGEVTVNGKLATLSTPINAGDTIQTGKGSEIIFVVNGNNSMILRDNSNLVMEARKPPTQPPAKRHTTVVAPEPREAETSMIASMKLLAGKLLSVSRNSPMQVKTSTATLGIRGTGFYVSSDPEQTYFCTCYGMTEVMSNNNPDIHETIKSEHHDRPVYIVNDPNGKDVRNAPFIDHTDQELALVEALVGRTTPFVFANDRYTSPRRDY